MNDIFNAIESISLTVASIAAIFGLFVWKKEAKWKKQSEFNEDILFTFYLCQDSIRKIRSPFTSNIEVTNVQANYKNVKTDKIDLTNLYVISERYGKESDNFNQLKKLKYRFKAVYPNLNIDSFLIIDDTINSIFKAANLLCISYWPQLGPDMPETRLKNLNLKIQKYEAIIWNGYLIPDEIEEKIESAIKKMEAQLNNKEIN